MNEISLLERDAGAVADASHETYHSLSARLPQPSESHTFQGRGPSVASEQLLAGLRGRTDSIGIFLAELFAIVSAMVVYFLIRGGLPEPAAEAVVRATGVIRLEQALGIFFERQWQEPLVDRRLLMQLANGI